MLRKIASGSAQKLFQYLEKKENDMVLNTIKSEIKLLLYNNKKLVKLLKFITCLISNIQKGRNSLKAFFRYCFGDLFFFVRKNNIVDISTKTFKEEIIH